MLPSPTNENDDVENGETTPPREGPHSPDLTREIVAELRGEDEPTTAATTTNPIVTTSSRRHHKMEMVERLVYISLFSFLGTYLRTVLSNATPEGFPTWESPNFIGSFALGVLLMMKSSAAFRNAQDLHLGLTVGFCGSLTTFSSWQTDVALSVAGFPDQGPAPMNAEVYLWFEQQVIGIAISLGGLSFGEYVGAEIVCFMEALEWRRSRQLQASREARSDGRSASLPPTPPSSSHSKHDAPPGGNNSHHNTDDRRENAPAPINLISTRLLINLLLVCVAIVCVVIGCVYSPGTQSFAVAMAPFGAVLRYVLALSLNDVAKEKRKARSWDSNLVLGEEPTISIARRRAGGVGVGFVSFVARTPTRLTLTQSKVPLTIPFWGTFTANIFASVLSASITLIQYSYAFSSLQCAALSAVQQGFCGSLSTISTFVNELKNLSPSSRVAQCYGIVSVLSTQVIVLIMFGVFVDVHNSSLAVEVCEGFI